MKKILRQLGFLTYAFFLRWPVWLLIWLAGRGGMFKTIFLIYPTDTSECLSFCPNIKWLRNFLSGRPTPAGLIMDSWRPIGIYLVIPDPAMELMRKKSRPMVETIIQRMLWVKKLSGAKTIGLAGQLGPIFEKRHSIPINPPFYSSTYGNIFSIQKAVSHLVSRSTKKAWQSSIAIVGGGLLADQLEEHLGDDGYQLSVLDVRYTRKGGVKLTDEQRARQQLESVDFVINLLPRGKDFLDCDLHQHMPPSSTIIDFSRPPIPPKEVVQKVVMGNRVQSEGIHFCLRLPGGWKRHELPACSMPSLLASLGGLPLKNLTDFREVAKQFQFYTALANPPSLQPTFFDSLLNRWEMISEVASRFTTLLLRRRQTFSR